MNVIITTTINAPNEIIRKYDNMADWDLIVVGDKKTPEYRLANGIFISWHECFQLYPDLCNLVGFNCTQLGRMIGLLEARKLKPELVATIDDDCDPYDGWPRQIHIGRRDVPFVCLETKEPVFNPFQNVFTQKPRGFPPQLKGEWFSSSMRHMTPLLQEMFWDGEPDYDAVYRVHGQKQELCACKEEFWSPQFSPVNTQNTLIAGSVLKDYVGEIPFVGHVGDIWAGYLFQAYHPESTLYAPATVNHWQERTLKSVLKDLKEEIYSYGHTLSFVKKLEKYGPNLGKVLPKKAAEAVKLYRSYFE